MKLSRVSYMIWGAYEIKTARNNNVRSTRNITKLRYTLTYTMSINYNFLLVYRNQPKLDLQAAMIRVFLQTAVSTDLHANAHNSDKLALNFVHLIIERASHYPQVPLIRNSNFARNDPFWSHIPEKMSRRSHKCGARSRSPNN